MARPRKNVSELIDDEVLDNTVKSSLNLFPVAVYDPTSIQPRIMEAYDQDQLDKYLAGGWYKLNNS